MLYQGKLINRIHHAGKGPREFSIIMDIKIDKDGNILVLDYNKILKYDPNGIYMNEINFNYVNNGDLNLSPHEFAPLPNGEFYFWRGSFAIEDKAKDKFHALYKVNKDGQITSEYFPNDKRILEWLNRFSENKNGHYNMQPIDGNDTIYSLSQNGVIPCYKIDFGKNSLPPGYLHHRFNNLDNITHEIVTNTDYCLRVCNVLENESFIYFAFLSRGKYCHALYSKNSKNVKVGTVYFKSIPCSIGLRAFNYETKEFISILDDEAIDILLGEKKENHSEFDKQIISALHNRNDSENPILVLFKLKDF